MKDGKRPPLFSVSGGGIFTLPGSTSKDTSSTGAPMRHHEKFCNHKSSFLLQKKKYEILIPLQLQFLELQSNEQQNLQKKKN